MVLKKKPKILIIEDSEFNRSLFRDVFEQGGFEVVLRDNADGFLPEEVSEVAPDIISMDLMLGYDGKELDQDGFDAITRLKGDLRTHEIPIIVVTSFFEEGKVLRAKELGAVDFITIPGQSIKQIPQHFKRYLENPKKYKPSHPLFR